MTRIQLESAALSQLRAEGFKLYRDVRGRPYAVNYSTSKILRGETWNDVRNQLLEGE
jgi:hypothetical protein